MTKGLCWLSLQDLAQKSQRASQRPGAWADAVIASNGNGVTNSVTQERWEKTRNKIRCLASWIRILDIFTPDTLEDVSLQKELT